MCACRACYLLFTQPGAGRGRYRAVPDRYLHDPGQADDAGRVGPAGDPRRPGVLPAQLARRAQVTGFYPSPAGRHRVPARPAAPGSGWPTSYPLLGAPAADVEAALISRSDSGVEYFLVPIDACYELAGRMRLYWRGFDGGTEARAEHRRVPGPGAASAPGRSAAGSGMPAWPSWSSTASARAPTSTRSCPSMTLTLRISETSGPAGRGDRAALPDPDRAGQAALLRRRGRAAERPVRRDAALGRHAQADPVHQRVDHGARLHRQHRDRPAGAAHLRHGDRRHPVLRRPGRRRGAAAAAVQRHGLRHRPTAGCRCSRCRGARRPATGCRSASGGRRSTRTSRTAPGSRSAR